VKVRYIDKFFRKNLSRRDLLKKTGKAALAFGGSLTLDALLSSCATIGFREESPVIYPPLRGHKIQPPKDGCYFGIGHPGRRGGDKVTDIIARIDYYEKNLGKRPSIVNFVYNIVSSNHMIELGMATASKNVIPLLQCGILNLEDSTNGEHDSLIREFADGAIGFGEEYGGFFYSYVRNAFDSLQMGLVRLASCFQRDVEAYLANI